MVGADGIQEVQEDGRKGWLEIPLLHLCTHESKQMLVFPQRAHVCMGGVMGPGSGLKLE